MTAMKSTLALALFAVLAPSTIGCDEATAAPETDYSVLLREISQAVAMPAHQNAASKADLLVAALTSLETAPTAESLQSAQNAWREARAAYRGLDAFTFGPLPVLGIDARVDVAPSDTGGIEQAIAGTDVLNADFVGRLGGKKKGYVAVEYLLFQGPGGDVLASFVANPRRGSLARALGDELAASMHQLLDAWDPAKNGWAKELETAGNGGHYESQLAAINDLVGGGAYALESIVGLRLALPLGRKNNNVPDPAQDPTLASDNTNADLSATLAGVASLYNAPGFTTLIRPKLAELDDKTLAQLGDCAAKISAMPRPFASTVTQNAPVVRAAFEACKALKLTWNTDVTSTLGANVKPLDTDGD